MSEDKTKDSEPGNKSPEAAPGGGNGRHTPDASGVEPQPDAAPPGAAATPATPAPSLEEKLAEQVALVAKAREQMLRVAADFDNFRKRSQRELEDVRRRAVQGLVKDLLPVFDNLERATAHLGDATDVQSLAEGLRMVRKQLESTLARLGIERLQTVGKAFDPAFHESIQYVESADQPAGAVMAEVQSGYVMGAELVRPAMVVVSRGAPAPASSDDGPAPANDDTAGERP